MPYLRPAEPLWKEISSIAQDEGLLLYDLERRGGNSLRVFVEKPGAQVASGDCSRMCRRLMVYFVAEGDRMGIGSEPEIEVSSPGINRQLRLPEHFVQSIGERVRVTLSGSPEEAAGSKMSIVGELQAVQESGATIVDESDGEVVHFPLSRVKRAQVDFRF